MNFNYLLILILVLLTISLFKKENFTGFRFYYDMPELKRNMNLFPMIPNNKYKCSNNKNTLSKIFPIIPTNFIN